MGVSSFDLRQGLSLRASHFPVPLQLALFKDLLFTLLVDFEPWASSPPLVFALFLPFVLSSVKWSFNLHLP